MEAAKEKEVEVLVMFALPELLLKLSKWKNVKIAVIYCHSLFEGNKDVLLNLTNSYRTPSPKDYRDAMEKAINGLV